MLFIHTLSASFVVGAVAFRVPSIARSRASSTKLHEAPMERVTGRSSMDTGILDRYMGLDQNGMIQAEYIW